MEKERKKKGGSIGVKIYKSNKKFLGGEVFTTDTGCAIIIAKEVGLWHMSISHESRLPTWDEIKQVRYDLLPRDRDFAMILPRPEHYINIHNYCFHLHEMTSQELPQVVKK